MSLQNNTTLHTLNLRLNSIADQGGNALFICVRVGQKAVSPSFFFHPCSHLASFSLSAAEEQDAEAAQRQQQPHYQPRDAGPQVRRVCRALAAASLAACHFDAHAICTQRPIAKCWRKTGVLRTWTSPATSSATSLARCARLSLPGAKRVLQPRARLTPLLLMYF